MKRQLMAVAAAAVIAGAGAFGASGNVASEASATSIGAEVSNLMRKILICPLPRSGDPRQQRHCTVLIWKPVPVDMPGFLRLPGRVVYAL